MTNESEVREVLERHPVVHMVGLSPNPERTSHRIAARLLARGFKVVPIHPGAAEVHGARAWPDLASAGAEGPVRMVNVFRASEALPGIVDEVLALGTVEVVWLQLNVHDAESEARLRAAGISVVTERCTGMEADRLDVIHGAPRLPV